MDKSVFAERAASVARHLRRVQDKLPENADALEPVSDATDAVILHLWQAVQIVIDIATSLCVKRGLGVPPTYGDADRLARAAGFRNLIVHAYADIDLARVHHIAHERPADLRAFLRSVRDALPPRH